MTEAASHDAVVSSILTSNRASTGSVSVTVSGSGLGQAGYSSGARRGVTACESSTWQSDTAISCQTSAGVSGTMRVAVTSG
eukprot:2277046-Rhodomonas_salina.1